MHIRPPTPNDKASPTQPSSTALSLDRLVKDLNETLLKDDDVIIRLLFPLLGFSFYLPPELWNLIEDYFNDYLRFELIGKAVRSDPTLQRRLWQLIEDSKVCEKDASKEKKKLIAASNAITLLNFAKISFDGCDLHHIRIPGARLEGAILRNAQLQGADLRGVFFRGACLERANLSWANMSEVNFGEKNYLCLTALSLMLAAILWMVII